MDEQTKKRLDQISWSIKELKHDAKRLERDLAKARSQIDELDAERWQLILTN